MAPIPSSRRLPLCGALLVLVAEAVTATAVAAAARSGDATMAARYERWTARFGRAYTDADEKARRVEVLEANTRHVDAVNRAGNRTYTLGLNQFSDLTDEEFVEAYLGYRRQPMPTAAEGMSKGAALQDYQDTPDSVDWRAQGAVAEVKNQHTCGSCWAFGGGGDGGARETSSPSRSSRCSTARAAPTPATAATSTPRSATSPPAAGCRRRQPMRRAANSHAELGRLRRRLPVGAHARGRGSAAGARGQPAGRGGRGGLRPRLAALQERRVRGSSLCGQQLNHAVMVVSYGAADGGEYWVVKIEEPVGDVVGREVIHARRARERRQLRHRHPRLLPDHGQLMS